MRTWKTAAFGLIMASFTGCSSSGVLEESPPKAYLKANNHLYETKVGTYCWKETCVDKAGPLELLKTEKPIEVKANESLALIIKHKRQPNERNMVQIQNKHEVDVPLKKNKLKAPSERGTYYYSYSVWWMDESQKNVSNGDALYAFVLEVK
ncbi:hypothetical protein [Priestia megaterium]|uniref:hypothetical protein n=1 Tax=Priestia megaterium TaxID=1404 RepID=UPI000D520343|nr:hypothetical protein [Priestia megaterium]PVE70887.1 hypothetical protein DC428_10575 [Priestia megaterium]PVE88942.1 hypothetical protein DC421_02420 [Priestia megaterium]PVE92632.1 hypothetical protein DC426_04075 [Priestia megaterium]PVF01624.1 hypothetical protein DC433_00660 [Priestia megaterium]